MDLAEGMEFTMRENASLAVNGRVVAKYLDGLVYRVTSGNKEFAADLIASGKARLGNFGQARVSLGRVAGAAKVK